MLLPFIFIDTNPIVDLAQPPVITFFTIMSPFLGGARGVIVIVVGNEHGDTSSNPGRD